MFKIVKYKRNKAFCKDQTQVNLGICIREGCRSNAYYTFNMNGTTVYRCVKCGDAYVNEGTDVGYRTVV